jgi:hypothetical protein
MAVKGRSDGNSPTACATVCSVAPANKSDESTMWLGRESARAGRTAAAAIPHSVATFTAAAGPVAEISNPGVEAPTMLASWQLR